MSAIIELTREAAGDRDLRGHEPFTRLKLTDDELTAATWAAVKFDSAFPGWQLLRRIRAGMTIYDNELDAWVVGAARLLARARVRKSGRCYVEKRGEWIDQAARDALMTVILLSLDRGWPDGLLPSVLARARQFGVESRTWLKIYRPITACLVIGLETFASELNAEYRKVKIQTPESSGNVAVGEPIDFSESWYGPQRGTWIENPYRRDTD